MRQTVYSNVNILLKLKYLRPWKAVLERFVYFNKIVNSGKSTLMGFFKGSQMLQQNSEFSSNDSWRCTCWMNKLWNPFVCDADQHFDMKVKCPPRRASLMGQFLHCAERNSSQMPGDGRFWNWMVRFLYYRDWKRECFDFSLIGIMLSMLKLLGNLTAQLWWNDLPWISLFTQNNECHVDDENLLSKKFVPQLLNWAFIWWTFWFLCPPCDKNWDALSTA